MMDDPLKPIISAVVGAVLKYGAKFISENADRVEQIELVGVVLMVVGVIGTIISFVKR